MRDPSQWTLDIQRCIRTNPKALDALVQRMYDEATAGGIQRCIAMATRAPKQHATQLELFKRKRA